MIIERRQLPRVKPYKLVYVSLSAQNRGLIIDATEEGFQFLAESPVDHAQGIVPARFTLSPLDAIETAGEITWLDDTNRAGGMRFRDIAAADRANIRDWLTHNAHLLPSREDDLDAGASGVTGTEPLAASDDGRASQSMSGPAQSAAPSAGISMPGSEFAVPWRSSVPAAPTGPQVRDRVSVSRHRARTIALVMLGLAVASTAVFAILFHWQIAERTRVIGQDLLNWVSTNSETSASTSPADTKISPLLQPPSKSHRTRLVAEGGGDADIPLSHDPGEAELAVALQYLGGDGGRAQTNVAVKWLWASVQKGNTKAATLLANVYEWGRGVPRNCEQARVLLIDAAKHGSTEAMQQLQDMDSDGCANTASK
jgi:hypothetical protein